MRNSWFGSYVGEIRARPGIARGVDQCALTTELLGRAPARPRQHVEKLLGATDLSASPGQAAGGNVVGV